MRFEHFSILKNMHSNDWELDNKIWVVTKDFFEIRDMTTLIICDEFY